MKLVYHFMHKKNIGKVENYCSVAFSTLNAVFQYCWAEKSIDSRHFLYPQSGIPALLGREIPLFQSLFSTLKVVFLPCWAEKFPYSSHFSLPSKQYFCLVGQRTQQFECYFSAQTSIILLRGAEKQRFINSLGFIICIYPSV